MALKKILGGYFYFFCFLRICFGQAEQAEKLDSIFSSEITAQLRADKEITRYQFKQDTVDYLLCPKTAGGEKIIRQWTKEEPPILAVESLYLYKKETPTAPGADNEEIGRILRSVSKMKGMTYYSNTRKEEEVLYSDAYTFKSPEDKSKIPDNTEGFADGKVLYMYQDDASFGNNYYEVSYSVIDTETLFLSRNIDYMYFSIFKVIKPDNLRIGVIVNDLGSEMTVYLLVQGSFKSFSLLEKYLYRSFTARTAAIYNWFLKSYIEGSLK